MQVVDLLEARLGELLHERGRVDAVGHEAHVREPAADAAERGEVDPDDVVDAGPLHLDDGAREAGVGGVDRAEDRAVRLAEGRGGDGRLVDPREGVGEGHAQLALRQRADLGEGDRGHFVLQVLELGRDLWRQHVQARRHELADLDHEPAELDGEHAEAAGEALHAPGARAVGDAAQADTGQEELVPPRDREVPRGEAEDAAVAGARLRGVGLGIRPGDGAGRGRGHSRARIA